jgi:hypothetical protein
MSDSTKRPASPSPDTPIDVSVPSVSGAYIKLDEEGKLGELLELQEKRDKLRQKQTVLSDQLSKFGDRYWLLEFFARTASRGKKYGPEIVREAARLESQRVQVNSELQEVEAQISRIDPRMLSIPLPATTIRLSNRKATLPPPTARWPVIARDHEIRRQAAKGLSDKEICKALDFELAMKDGPPVGIPEKWVEQFEREWHKQYAWNFYSAAYATPATRNRMQKMISKAKG